MNKKKLIIGAALTGMMMGISSVRAQETSTESNAPEESVIGKCYEANSCKGTGACGGKDHSCAGKNSCKGQGWIKLTQAECTEKGGAFNKI